MVLRFFKGVFLLVVLLIELGETLDHFTALQLLFILVTFLISSKAASDSLAPAEA